MTFCRPQTTERGWERQRAAREAAQSTSLTRTIREGVSQGTPPQEWKIIPHGVNHLQGSQPVLTHPVIIKA